MPSQNRPASPKHAPEASHTYERLYSQDHPDVTAPNPQDATPTDAPDVIEKTVTNRQDGSRQLNGETDMDRRAHA